MIVGGAVRVGEALPSERELSAMTKISRVTVRKAIDTLLREGMLSRRPGSGTYVSTRIEQPAFPAGGLQRGHGQPGQPAGLDLDREGGRPADAEEAMTLAVGPDSPWCGSRACEPPTTSRWPSSGRSCRRRCCLPSRTSATRSTARSTGAATGRCGGSSGCSPRWRPRRRRSCSTTGGRRDPAHRAAQLSRLGRSRGVHAVSLSGRPLRLRHGGARSLDPRNRGRRPMTMRSRMSSEIAEIPDAAGGCSRRRRRSVGRRRRSRPPSRPSP